MTAMRCVILGSGSRGNATLVETARTRILVDAGLPVADLHARLARAGGAGGRGVDGIVVTHAHKDHAGFARAYAKELDAPLYVTEPTRRSVHVRSGKEPRVFGASAAFSIGDLEIHPLPVPHDAPQVALVIGTQGARVFGLVTDAGEATSALVAHFTGVPTVLVESNYDEELLQRGPYPESVKARVRSRTGHLANRQCGALLRALDARTRTVVLMHLSETNNTEALALEAARDGLSRRPRTRILVASQDAPLEVPLHLDLPRQLRLAL